MLVTTTKLIYTPRGSLMMDDRLLNGGQGFGETDTTEVLIRVDLVVHVPHSYHHPEVPRLHDSMIPAGCT